VQLKFRKDNEEKKRKNDKNTYLID